MMTLEQMLSKESDAVLLSIHHEIVTGVVPVTGSSHQYCRKVNRMIDAGQLQINPTSYRRIYMPALTKAVLRELARRYVRYCRLEKGGEVFDDSSEI